MRGEPLRRQPYELDPETVEWLLAGLTGDLGPELTALAELLAAAREPAYPDELTGMDAALATFRQASRTRHARARGNRITLRRLSAKATVPALVIAALGGGAVAAAATGAFPVPLLPAHPAATRAPAPPAPASTSPAAPLDARLTQRGSAPPAKGAHPRKGLVGLCRAFKATGNTNDRRLSPLVEAAGGRDKVPAYCAKVPQGGPGTKAEHGGQGKGDNGSPKSLQVAPAPARTQPNPPSPSPSPGPGHRCGRP